VGEGVVVTVGLETTSTPALVFVVEGEAPRVREDVGVAVEESERVGVKVGGGDNTTD